MKKSERQIRNETVQEIIDWLHEDFILSCHHDEDNPTTEPFRVGWRRGSENYGLQTAALLRHWID